MTSEFVFTAVIVLVIAQRLVELVISRRNVGRLRERGGVEFGAGHYPWMVVLHVAFLASCVAEPWFLDRPVRPLVAIPMLVVASVGMALRGWTLATLGDRWTTRVVVVPGELPVTSGPYRLLRHPNYLAVALEIFAIPMIHTAWLTATVFSVLNAVLLRVRIQVEERALSRHTTWDRDFERSVETES